MKQEEKNPSLSIGYILETTPFENGSIIDVYHLDWSMLCSQERYYSGIDKEITKHHSLLEKLAKEISRQDGLKDITIYMVVRRK